MEQNKETEEKNLEHESVQGKVKGWLQDNMRIIISIIVVVLIAGGIYSYSKRTEAPQVSESSVAVNDEENSSSEAVATTEENTEEENKNAGGENISAIATSQETQGSFIETAAKGDSQTTLARKALADFLEKNPDSALTNEHMIFIEDYLRKNSGYNGRVYTGTSVEFSKDLIKDAIAKSKNLNEKQLQNLRKYTARVATFS